jgi:cell division protein FtsB
MAKRRKKVEPRWWLPFRISRRWIAVGVLGLVGFLYYQPLRSYLDTREQVAVRAVEVEELAAQRRALERRLRAQTGDAALLRAARELGYVKPGERLYIVKGIEAWRRARARAGAPAAAE